MPRLPPEVPPDEACTAVLPVPPLNAAKPEPPILEKLRAPTPAPSGLREVPPAPGTTPLVAAAKPPTATGGIVVVLKTKGGGVEPPCVAATMALLKAVVLPVKLPAPATSSLAAG